MAARARQLELTYWPTPDRLLVPELPSNTMSDSESDKLNLRPDSKQGSGQNDRQTQTASEESWQRTTDWKENNLRTHSADKSYGRAS